MLNEKIKASENVIIKQLSLKFAKVNKHMPEDCFYLNSDGLLTKRRNKEKFYITNTMDDIKSQLLDITDDFYNKIADHANDIAFIEISFKYVRLVLTDGTVFYYDPVIATNYPLTNPLEKLNSVLLQNCDNWVRRNFECDDFPNDDAYEMLSSYILFLNNATAITYSGLYTNELCFQYDDHFTDMHAFVKVPLKDLFECYPKWTKEQLTNSSSRLYHVFNEEVIPSLTDAISEGNAARQTYNKIMKIAKKK